MAMEYIILILTLVFVALLCKIFNVNIKNNKYFLLSLIVILTIFLCVRGPGVGIDMKNYYKFFIDAKNSSFGHLFLYYDFEIGFKFFTKILSFLNNFRIYIAIISIISMLGVYSFIKENSKNYFASVFMFVTFGYFIYYTCTLRQCLAISLVLGSYSFLKKEKLLYFFAMIFIAAIFHKTAFVFLILPLFKNFRLDHKKIIYYIILCVFLFIIKEQIIDVLTNTIYSQYIYFEGPSGEGYNMLLFVIAIILGVCFIGKKTKINYDDDKYLIGMMLLTLPFQVMATYQGLVARIVLYFMYSFIILVPNSFEVIKIKYQKILYPLFYCLLFLFYLYQIFTNSVYVDYTIF